MSLLNINNLNSGYGNKQILFDASLGIEEGDVVLLIGSNGSGKSTLLKTICGIIPVWSGSIKYDGVMFQTKEKASPTHTLLKQGIQYMPQKNELFDDATVMENLQFSLLHLNNEKETAKRIEELLEEIPSLKPMLKQRAAKLSGGERKKLCLGMVMVNHPRLLLYDEPLAGMSDDNIPDMIEMLTKLRTTGTTMLIVEHHVTEMMLFADKTYGMQLGSLSGELESIYLLLLSQ